MSRVGVGDVITVKATNNMYTVLVCIAFLAELIALAALFMKSSELFDKGLF